MSDALIPTAPGFETPIEMLEACHERLQAQLKTLARLAAWLPDHGPDRQARQAAANVMRYFDLAAVNHHLDEEQDLLPLLRERATPGDSAELNVLIDWILDDHRSMLAAWSTMRARLEPILRGEAADLPAADVECFAARYRRHIEREEAELLPWARKLLNGRDVENLAAAMTARRRVPPPGGAAG